MMRKGALLCWLLTIFAFCGTGFATHSEKGVRVTPDEAHHRVDVTIDGRPFTSYIWPVSLKKPVLFPLMAPDGTIVTRGYPLAPRAGERIDHPHHAGMWFNSGKVNGFDFWNNSDVIKPEKRARMGRIYQEKIVSARSGQDSGELIVDSVWVTGKNQRIIQERTRYVFRQGRGERIIDELTTLRALDHVVFNDDKEGLLGIRVARFLESPTRQGRPFKSCCRDRCLSHQRGQEGRRGLGNARTLVYLNRRYGKQDPDNRNSRPSREPGLSHLLARTRIRALRRQPSGTEHIQSQAAADEFHPGEKSSSNLSLSHHITFSRHNAGGDEPRCG